MFLSCLVMVGGICGNGGKCGLNLSVEFCNGEFVKVLQSLFDTVHCP